MGRIKGMRDIKTLSTLDREGLLVGVAKNLHRMNRGGSIGSSEGESWSGKVEPAVFNKSAAARKPSRGLFQDLELEKKILKMRIEQVRESIVEMEMFASEGVSGVLGELERLKEKLFQLENG